MNANPSKTTNVVVAFSTKTDGDMGRTNTNRIDVIQRRSKFIRENGLAGQDVAFIRPSHCPNIELLHRDRPARRITRQVLLGSRVIDTDFDNYWDGSDGILTLDAETAVALVSADCTPVMVWEQESKLHGILHVGLLGALNNLVSGLARVATAIGTSTSSLSILLGPSIGAEDYKISTSGLWAAIEGQVMHSVPDVKKYILEDSESKRFDVRQMLLDQLVSTGVKPHNISIMEGSTASPDSKYFSHHIERDGDRDTRRFISIIGWAAE